MICLKKKKSLTFFSLYCNKYATEKYVWKQITFDSTKEIHLEKLFLPLSAAGLGWDSERWAQLAAAHSQTARHVTDSARWNVCLCECACMVCLAFPEVGVNGSGVVRHLGLLDIS